MSTSPVTQLRPATSDLAPSETLDEIGLRFGTDKASSHHDYLVVYERFLEHLRNRELKILEVGVYNGASLRMWEVYFPLAKIVGVDIAKKALNYASSRIQIELADQSNLEDLVSVALKHGPFDIVIEDGSHMWEHQITSLRTLFPFVNVGGVYIVEDLQVSYGAYEANYRGVSSNSCMDYLLRFVNQRVASDPQEISRQEDAFIRTYATQVQTLTFLKHACVLVKGSRSIKPRARRVATDYLVGRSPAGDAPHLTVHFGNVGDVTSATGSVRSNDAGVNIQGFALTKPHDSIRNVEYRARTAEGGWSPWVMAGSFAGSRGQDVDLVGFAVRNREGGEPGATVRLAGYFRDSDQPVVSTDGECMSSTGAGALYGMQVLVEPPARLGGAD